MSEVSATAGTGGDDRHRDVKWFAKLAGIELGPMPWSDLAALAERRELCPSDEVRSEDESAWTLASKNGLLFPERPADVPRRKDREPATELSSIDAQPPASRVRQRDPELRKVVRATVAEPEQPENEIDDRDATDDEVLQMLTEPVADHGPIPAVAAAVSPEAPPAAPLPVPTTPLTPLMRPASSERRPLTVLSRITRLPETRPKTSVALIVILLLSAIGMFWRAMSPSYEGLRVTGRVTLDGAAVRNATVTFYDRLTGAGANALLDESGQFELATQTGGIPAGNYSVYVHSKTRGVIPERYLSLNTSGLSFDVPGDGSAIEIQLHSMPSE